MVPCKEYTIARDTVLEYITHKTTFTYKELLTDIKNRGGLPQISPSRTLSEYLDDFAEKGVIKIDPVTNIFQVPSNKRS